MAAIAMQQLPGSGAAGEGGLGAPAAQGAQPGAPGASPAPPTLLSQRTQEQIANQLASCYLAAVALVASLGSVAVWRAAKKAAKPILISAAVQYCLLSAVLIPVSAVSQLVALLTSNPALAFSSHRVVSASLALYPLATVLFTKYFHKQALEGLFFASLAELDPAQAAVLARGEHAQQSRLKERFLGLVTDEADDPTQMLILMLVASLLRSWRGLGLGGPLALVLVPIAQFCSVRYLVGRPRLAIALTAAAVLVPAVEPLVMDVVEVWASSRALGQSSMRHFMKRAIPKHRHAAFVRTFEATIFAYFAPLVGLLRLGPLRYVLGPVVAFPAAAVAARCVHDITTRESSGAGVVKAMQKAE